MSWNPVAFLALGTIIASLPAILLTFAAATALVWLLMLWYKGLP